MGATILAIVTDGPARNASLARDNGYTFPILSDAKRTTIRAYNVVQKGRNIAKPAVFVLRKDRSIAWKYISPRVPIRPPVAELLAQVRKAR